MHIQNTLNRLPPTISSNIHLHGTRWWIFNGLSAPHSTLRRRPRDTNWLNELSGTGESLFPINIPHIFTKRTTPSVYYHRSTYPLPNGRWKMVNVKTRGDLMDNLCNIQVRKFVQNNLFVFIMICPIVCGHRHMYQTTAAAITPNKWIMDSR